MCGIAGVWDFKDKISPLLLQKMTDALHHRGPDDSGIFVDPQYHVGLGHRRLSILDLSPAGHQPMPNDDQTIWITFNGEIYNFKEIRQELELKGHTFKSSSDTEVMLKAYQEWGMESIKKYRGMFAFAIWDKKKEKLYLVRDRAGVKPLYYYVKNNILLFASELKSFHEHDKFEKEINFDALALFLQFGYILAPHTIFQHAHKVKPGHYLEVDNQGKITETKYWDIIDYYLAEPISKSEDEITKDLERILTESFQYRMVSDVPVGVFLSGGIDSSLVAAILQKNSKVPLKTFTIGFEEKGHNEAPHAKKVAEHLKTDHHELYCTAKDALEIIPKLADIYDEPFGDSSGIPTYLVSKFAREHVKVALSADAGDELFAGYAGYRLISGFHNTMGKIPSFLVAPLSFGLSLFSVDAIERIYKVLFFLPRHANIRGKIHKFKNVLANKKRDLGSLVLHGYSYWTPAQITKMLKKPHRALETHFSEFQGLGSLPTVSQMQAVDYKTFLVDDILTKVDRATMAVGLEAREPFLDQHIAEFAARIPLHLKHREGQTKYILRKILYKYVPKELLERPKQGFSIPIDSWFKTDLHGILREYLSKEKIKAQGIFDENYISESLERYLSGKSDSAHKFWFLLMFQMWHERWMK